MAEKNPKFKVIICLFGVGVEDDLNYNNIVFWAYHYIFYLIFVEITYSFEIWCLCIKQCINHLYVDITTTIWIYDINMHNYFYLLLCYNLVRNVIHCILNKCEKYSIFTNWDLSIYFTIHTILFWPNSWGLLCFSGFFDAWPIGFW